MLVQSHDTGGFDAPQALALVEEAWVTEVLPRLPAALAEQARALKALQRVRGLATPYDLLRGVLAYGLWLLGERIAVPTPSAPAVPRPTGRLLLVDTRCLGQPGGTRGCLAAASGLRLPGRADETRAGHGPSRW